MLPLPSLSSHCQSGITFLTDDALASSVGVRIGFTGRSGGVSTAPFDSLNLGQLVQDNPVRVEENIARLQRAVAPGGCLLVTPRQVHGTQIVTVDSAKDETFCQAQEVADKGADSVVVTIPEVMALLVFADCAPVILASDLGGFAVVHAGWRGAVAGIVGKTVRSLCARTGCSPAGVNLYVGPHIHSDCFEVGSEVAREFSSKFGPGCLRDERHVSLRQAIFADAEMNGVLPQRMVDSGICTKCHADDYYSYRATDGLCGRHGAFGLLLREGE